MTLDLRLDQPRWRLKSRNTGLRIYLRAPSKGGAKVLAAGLYGGTAAHWKAKRVRG